MSFNPSILSQVLKEVNKNDFKNQVSKYQGDYKASVFSCYNLMTSMIYSQITKKESTRDISNGIESMHSDFFHLGLNHVKRTTLSDALNTRSEKIFEDYFYKLMEDLTPIQKRRFIKKVNIIDSTTISFCLKKFDWATFKTAKGGIKLHTMIDYDTLIPEKVLISNANVHDIKGIYDKIDFKTGEIYVYDRGYASYSYLYSIEAKQAFYVTRIKDNWNIIRTASREVDTNTGVMLDETIEVVGSKKKDYPIPLRMITFHHKETGKIFRFITNNFEMNAFEIAEIYKGRWQVELFFKWIKQHLKIKSFYSTSENGVKIQIWCALITYLLLLKIMNKFNIKFSIFHFLRKISNFIDKRIYMYDLLYGFYEKFRFEKKSEQMELQFL